MLPISGKNVHSVIMERVPCKLAKPNPDGSVGSHAAMILLDKRGNLLSVKSECQHLHGDGIQALHELSEGQTCYAVNELVWRVLRQLKNTGTVPSELFDPRSPWLCRQPHLLNALQRVAKQAEDSKDERWNPPELDVGPRQMPLQLAVNKVAGNVFHIPEERYVGAKFGTVSVPPVSYMHPAQLFRVDYWYTGSVSDKTGIDVTKHTQATRCYVLLPAQQSTYVFAARNERGDWLVFDDQVKSWATSNYKLYGNDHNRCQFCSETFSRMRKHLDGAKHLDQVLNAVKFVCKATSRTGLRMLNNPKHRTAFLRSAVK